MNIHEALSLMADVLGFSLAVMQPNDMMIRYDKGRQEYAKLCHLLMFIITSGQN